MRKEAPPPLPARGGVASAPGQTRGEPAGEAAAKPGPDEALALLKAGNKRFAAGKCAHPHLDGARLRQAGTENQGDFTYATVLACSDSRVPVERIFDAGIMDLFVVRVAGNVCVKDVMGSIEYGLVKVKAPVLVILGHSQCGAVTAAAREALGESHLLPRNIPPLLAQIRPAVHRAMHKHAGCRGDELVTHSIEENIWQGFENLFLESPAVRDLVEAGAAKAAGAVYDVASGIVAWLDEKTPIEILNKAARDPARAISAMA